MGSASSSTKKDVLISIRSPYSDLIVDGVKKTELRRKFPNLVPGSKMVIYSSGITKKIIGECEIEKVEQLPLEILWKSHAMRSMVEWDYFQSYFSGLDYGFAISVIKPKRYRKEVALPDYKRGRHLSSPPQSYCYL